MHQHDRDRAQHHHAQDKAWIAALQQAFDAAMPDSRTGGLCSPTIQVLSVSNSGARIELELRYRAGHRYCCAEWMCHLPVCRRRWWGFVRESLRANTDRDPPPMTLHVYAVVEAGALLTSMAAMGLPVESPAYSYDAGVSAEADANS